MKRWVVPGRIACGPVTLQPARLVATRAAGGGRRTGQGGG